MITIMMAMMKLLLALISHRLERLIKFLLFLKWGPRAEGLRADGADRGPGAEDLGKTRPLCTDRSRFHIASHPREFKNV